MATGIAHELNQPLTVIKMASGFFMKKLQQGEPIPESILGNMSEKINNNVDRANRIINHMREFARKSELSLERVQVNDVLERAHDIFSQQLKLRQIEVVWELAEDLPRIDADPGRLEQVFINLLVNARDAIEERWEGIVEPGDKLITLKTEVHAGRVVVEVGDTGRGIPEAVADKIFEPFFTTKEVGKGTGLGLSISYGIVKDFQGDIRVAASAEGGACFHLEFPVSESAAAG
jgi:histidine kinase